MGLLGDQRRQPASPPSRRVHRPHGPALFQPHPTHPPLPPAGSGKSTAAAAAAVHAASALGWPVAVHFCRASDVERLDPLACLRSLAYQVGGKPLLTKGQPANQPLNQPPNRMYTEMGSCDRLSVDV